MCCLGDDRTAVGVADKNDRSGQRGHDIDDILRISVKITEGEYRRPVAGKVDCK